MLGKGWFPALLGGLDRYFRDLLEQQPEASGVVIGPAAGAPDRVRAVSRHSAALPWRLLAFGVAARRAARDADVIDAHFALYAIVPLLSRRLRALPLVVHFQGPWADENVAQGDDSRARVRLRRLLERTVYKRATRIVVLSSAFRRVLVERYGVSPWLVRVVPPGVDLERFTPEDREGARARLGLTTSPFVAVCVRRLVPRMGLDDLIDAWIQVVAELPSGALLLIAGDGPMRGELQERIVERKLEGSVRLLGRIDDTALVDLYRAADVGVVPTRSFEGFGLVVIEAAACGTPTIVTGVGGLPEAVAGLDRSLTVSAADVSGLAARIALAANADDLPSRWATRRFAEGFSWRSVVDRNRVVCGEAMAPEAAERRMRVVYLDHVAQLSGGELALLHLLPHLSRVDPHVILAEDGPLAQELVHGGISTEVFPMSERARGLRKGDVGLRRLPLGAAAATVSYTLRLTARLRRTRPDLVHANSLKAGVYGSVAARLAGVPVIWHVRDRIAPDYLPKPAVRVLRFMTLHLATAVIANSDATRRTLDSRARPVVLPSIGPAVLRAPGEAGQQRGRSFTVGMIGRLAPWKGQDLFLRAFADAFRETDARCQIVGAALFGETDFEQRLHVLADELGLGTRVEFRGFRADVGAELARMDLLVHASVIPEPYGQVIMQAMTAGVAAVAADAGGPAEMIEHGVNGLLYRMGDEAALAAAMRRVAGDSDLRRRVVQGGMTTVTEQQPSAVAARVEQLYRDVVAGARTIRAGDSGSEGTSWRHHHLHRKRRERSS
ncbi:MAG TPA: glycosyltransferase [Solirubrobacteraceae bacterium]